MPHDLTIVGRRSRVKFETLDGGGKYGRTEKF